MYMYTEKTLLTLITCISKFNYFSTDIEQLKRMTSNVSSDNENVKTKLEELELKFEGNIYEMRR